MLPNHEIRIPVMKAIAPSFENALPRLRAIDSRGLYSNFGPQELELRDRFAEFFGVDVSQIATANNATTGLTGAVALSSAKTWRLPAFTFAASPSSVISAGKKLRFEDIEPDWWLSDLAFPAEDGVMPVVPFGGQIDLGRWQNYPNVVLDAAASLGSRMPDFSALREDWAVVFSLHATKVLGSGEGAVLIFGSADYASRFRAWTNFGFLEPRTSGFAGVNGKLPEIQAAYVHAALDFWVQEESEWLAAKNLALQAHKNLPVLGQPFSVTGINPYWIVTFESDSQTLEVEKMLYLNGIESRRWWGKGCHKMEAFESVSRGELETTNQVAGVYLGLPMFRGLAVKEVEQIEKVIAEVCHV